MKIFFSVSSHIDIDKRYIEETDYISSKLNKNDLIIGCLMNEGMSGVILNNFKDSNITLKTLEIYGEDISSYPNVKIEYFDTTFDRTKSIYDTSDVLLILPGGSGTYAEIFSILEEMRTNKNNKKLVIYNYDGYYNVLIKLLGFLISEKFNDNNIFNYISVFNNRDDLIKYIGGEDYE